MDTQNRPFPIAIETLTSGQNASSVADMSNVLNDTKQQQILALGRLGGYLKAAGIAVHGRGRSESKPNRTFPRRCPPTLYGRPRRAAPRAPARASRIGRSSSRRSRVAATPSPSGRTRRRLGQAAGRRELRPSQPNKPSHVILDTVRAGSTRLLAFHGLAG